MEDCPLYHSRLTQPMGAFDSKTTATRQTQLTAASPARAGIAIITGADMVIMTGADLERT